MKKEQKKHNIYIDHKLISGFMGFWKRLFRPKQHDSAVKAAEESAQIRALKVYISNLEAVIEAQTVLIQGEVKGLGKYNNPEPIDKVIDTLSSLFLGDKPPTFTQQQSHPPPHFQEHEVLESGVLLNDDEIKDLIKNVPNKYIKMAQTMPTETVKKIIKSQFPNISDTSIIRAVELIK